MKNRRKSASKRIINTHFLFFHVFSTIVNLVHKTSEVAQKLLQRQQLT